MEKEGLTIMKKYIISFSLIFTFSLSADGHSNVKPGEETGEFHYFNVTNPAKFVEAVGQALPRTPNQHPTLQALSGKETRRYDLAASEASLKTFIEGACA